MKKVNINDNKTRKQINNKNYFQVSIIMYQNYNICNKNPGKIINQINNNNLISFMLHQFMGEINLKQKL